MFAHKRASDHTLAFTWVLGIQTLVQVLVQHSFCPLSYLLGSSQLIFWRTHSLFVCLRHTNKKRNKQTKNPELMKFIPGGSLDNKNLAWATTEEKNTLQKWKYLGGNVKQGIRLKSLLWIGMAWNLHHGNDDAELVCISVGRVHDLSAWGPKFVACHKAKLRGTCQ